MSRKIVQVASVPESDHYYGKIFALADDGSLWWIKIEPNAGDDWSRLPDLPQMTDEERPLYCLNGRIIGSDKETDEERPEALTPKA